jgi:cell division septation protein DedD
VKALDPAVFAPLARQTEILAGDGAARTKGKWRVLVGTAASEEAALELYDQTREAGFAARVRLSQVEGEGWRYAVWLSGFSSAAEAEAAAARLKAATDLKPGVGR